MEGPRVSTIRGTAERSRARKQHEHRDREDILHDEPSDRDAALGREQLASVHEGVNQHDRAGHRDCEAKDDGSRHGPAQEQAQTGTEDARDGDLPHGARDRDGTHGHEVAQREAEAHPEHEQDDTELGEFPGQVGIGDEAGRIGADQDARQKVAHDRRQAKPLGREPAEEGKGQADGDGRDERGFVGSRHGRDLRQPWLA